MSIATVVTRGFGSFGSVNLLPVLGYSLTIPVGPGICAAGVGIVQGSFVGEAAVAGSSVGGWKSPANGGEYS